MSQDPRNIPQIFHIDVSAGSGSKPAGDKEAAASGDQVVVGLLQQMLAAQHRQNQLLEELVNHSTAAQKQRALEIQQWQKANPHLAKQCRTAAETLGRVQTEFLSSLAFEVSDNEECLVDGDFMLNEFVDRFGPRLAHLNGLLQVLSQLSGGNNDPNQAKQN